MPDQYVLIFPKYIKKCLSCMYKKDDLVLEMNTIPSTRLGQPMHSIPMSVFGTSTGRRFLACSWSRSPSHFTFSATKYQQVYILLVTIYI